MKGGKQVKRSGGTSKMTLHAVVCLAVSMCWAHFSC